MFQPLSDHFWDRSLLLFILSLFPSFLHVSMYFSLHAFKRVSLHPQIILANFPYVPTPIHPFFYSSFIHWALHRFMSSPLNLSQSISFILSSIFTYSLCVICINPLYFMNENCSIVTSCLQVVYFLYSQFGILFSSASSYGVCDTKRSFHFFFL